MKLLAHIALTLLILASSVGVTVASHYCGYTLQQVAVNAEADPCCHQASMPEGCCHDEIKHFSVDEQYHGQNSLQMDASAKLVLQTLTYFFTHELFKVDEELSTWTAYQSPPPAESDIYIKVQSFLI